ncbi:MAG: hypothetical protein WDZ57_00735 [Demequina sp.]
MDNTETVKVKGAKPQVQVTGVHGVFYKVLLDGEPLKPTKGKWLIPVRGGGTVQMRSRGFLPGFQKLFVEGEQVFDMGGNVSLVEKLIMFVPLVLIFINPILGLPLGLLMFFMNISLVKNAVMPRALRIALPLINAAAAAFVILLLTGAV